MSNAKNTQTEKAAATETPVKKDGPMVYCGPTVKNTVKQYTVCLLYTSPSPRD